MWSQTCNTAAGVTLGTAIIVPVHIAAHLAITTFIPQFALPFKLGQTLYGLYNNSDALVRDIAGLYNALSKGEYFEFGESLIATGYDAVVVRNGSKILYPEN